MRCPAAFYRQATAKRGTLGGMASTGDTWRLGHRPALDGLRGVAILLVLFGHLGAPGMRDHGKTGVAVFFALSGFLITSLLLEEHDRLGRIDLRRFYARRLLRLAPAQLACVLVVTPFALQLGSDYVTLPQAVSAATYAANLYEPTTIGVFGHFWSLAVEEQFYLLLAPAVALILPRAFLQRGRMVAGLLALAAAAFFARQVWSGVSYRLDESLVLVADTLMLGCALAVAMHGRPSPKPRPVIAAAALGALGLQVALLPTEYSYRYGMTLAAALTVVMIRTTATGRSEWLSGRVLRWFGRRSYALYLWHYPIVLVLAAGFHVDSFVNRALVVLPVSLALAELSARYVEAPFLRLRETVSGHQAPCAAENGLQASVVVGGDAGGRERGAVQRHLV